MPAMFIVAVAATGLVLAVLAVVVAGIRQEPPAQELTRQPPRLMARLTRRLLGVYVRSPDPSVITDQQRGEPGHAPDPARPPAGHARHTSVTSDRAPGGGTGRPGAVREQTHVSAETVCEVRTRRLRDATDVAARTGA